MPLGVVPSDAPVRTPSGDVLVPADSGMLAIVTGGAVHTVAVGASALRRPALDNDRHRVIVAAGDGVVASIELGQ